jgi:hypothetical protein
MYGKQYDEKSALKIAAEVIFTLVLLLYVTYITFYSIIIIMSNGSNSNEVIAQNLYIFGSLDIVLFIGLYFMYQRLQIVNFVLLLTAIVISIVNNQGNDITTSAVVDAYGALCTVFIIIVNIFMILIPTVVYFCQPAGRGL